jgi:hypothetical protein
MFRLAELNSAASVAAPGRRPADRPRRADGGVRRELVEVRGGAAMSAGVI